MKHDHYFDGAAARLLGRLCDRVVCVSETMAAQFNGRSNVSVVYPGTELPPRQAPSATGQLIVALGRLDPHKGFDDVLRATAILRGRGFDAKVHVAGWVDRVHSEHAAELERLVEELGLREHCRVGYEEDVPGLLQRARVLCMASRPVRPGGPSEGAPTVLMEAMVCSRPSVAPREPGIAEVMGDAGTLVDPVTPRTLADALEPYLRDEALAVEVGERGRERAERLFDMELTAKSLTRLYGALAASRSATASATSPVRAALGSLRRRFRS
jgi:glycosyltransferase involved in cell wall biosynthesis